VELFQRKAAMVAQGEKPCAALVKKKIAITAL